MNRRIWPIEEKQAIVPERMKAAESMAALLTLHRPTASQDFAGASNSWLEDALASLSPQQKAILADLLAKVRASLLPRFTRDAAINVSASYETSDPSHLIKRLGKYVPASAPEAERRTAGKKKWGQTLTPRKDGLVAPHKEQGRSVTPDPRYTRR